MIQADVSLANVILTIHVGFILFVAGGLPVIWVGAARGWDWVRGFWFRTVHLMAILYVMAEAWFGVACPLTLWEMRARAATPGLAAGFIPYWLHHLFFYRLPSWVFGMAYTLFAVAVAVTYWFVPPRRWR